MINQNATISQQPTLWNQTRSRVNRGKRDVYRDLVYMVPLYLTAAATDFPQLKRVIAIAGDRVVMEPTLDEAIAALFGAHPPKVVGTAAQPAPTETRGAAADIGGPASNSKTSKRPRVAEIGLSLAAPWTSLRICWPIRRVSDCMTDDEWTGARTCNQDR